MFLKMRPHTIIMMFLVALVAEAAVVNMKDNPKALDKREIKQTMQQASGKASSKSGVKVGKFSWKDCGTTSSLVKIKSLSITPDPLALPGPLNVAMEVNITQNLNAPLPTSVRVEKEALGKYIKVPCIDSFGSCTYDDLCDEINQYESCPASFQAINLDCMCSFNKGTYDLPQTAFDIDVARFPRGQYHMVGNVTSKGTIAMCLDMYITLE